MVLDNEPQCPKKEPWCRAVLNMMGLVAWTNAGMNPVPGKNIYESSAITRDGDRLDQQGLNPQNTPERKNKNGVGSSEIITIEKPQG